LTQSADSTKRATHGRHHRRKLLGEGIAADLHRARAITIRRKFGKASKLVWAVEVIEEELNSAPNQTSLAGRVEQVKATQDEALP
jgi:hypothetical protein